MKKILISFLVIGFALNTAAFSQAELDTAFNSTGVQATPLAVDSVAGEIAVRPDNKIVVVGVCGSAQCLARYNENGSLDTGFGQQGLAINSSVTSGSRLALQNDGKIVVGGVTRENGPTNPMYSNLLTLSRYTADGTIDSSFAGGNVIIRSAGQGLASPTGVVVQPDGKIVVVGDSQPWTSGFPSTTGGWIVRYLSDGTPDTSFGSNGVINISGAVATGCGDVALQPDGKLLFGIRQTSMAAGGSGRYTVQRWNPDGSLDPSWDGDGIADLPILNIVQSLQVMPDGRVMGVTVARTVFRFNPDGSLDNSFAGDGVMELPAATGSPYSLTVSASGKITVVGYAPQSMGTYRFSISRFLVDGSVETGFGTNGVLILNPVGPNNASFSTSSAMDSLGRVVVGGYGSATPNRFVLARLTAPAPAGMVGISGRVTSANGNPLSGAIVILSGEKTYMTARTNPFGYYVFANVQSGKPYKMSPGSKKALFDDKNVFVDGEVSGFNIVALEH